MTADSVAAVPQEVPQPVSVPAYSSWRHVPPGLATATRLSEMEFPRSPGQVAATVGAFGHNGKWTDLKLYRVNDCPPTRTTAARLAELTATGSVKFRMCDDCGARTEFLLDRDHPRCRTCRHIHRLREAQTVLAGLRAEVAEKVAGWLATDRAVIVAVNVTGPGPTPSGKQRPATVMRVRALDATSERRLLDVRMRLVSPKSKFAPEDAGDPDKLLPKIHRALVGKILLTWSPDELVSLRARAPHEQWARWGHVPDMHSVEKLSANWRGELDPYASGPDARHALPAVNPGTLDRLLLHLRRIEATHRG